MGAGAAIPRLSCIWSRPHARVEYVGIRVLRSGEKAEPEVLWDKCVLNKFARRWVVFYKVCRDSALLITSSATVRKCLKRSTVTTIKRFGINRGAGCHFKFYKLCERLIYQVDSVAWMAVENEENDEGRSCKVMAISRRPGVEAAYLFTFSAQCRPSLS
jgi:hypothetical protein